MILNSYSNFSIHFFFLNISFFLDHAGKTKIHDWLKNPSLPPFHLPSLPLSFSLTSILTHLWTWQADKILNVMFTTVLNNSSTNKATYHKSNICTALKMLHHLHVHKNRSAKRICGYRLVLNWNLRYAMRMCRRLINEEVRGGGKWGEKLRLVKLGQCLVMTIKLFIIVEF